MQFIVQAAQMERRGDPRGKHDDLYEQRSCIDQRKYTPTSNITLQTARSFTSVIICCAGATRVRFLKLTRDVIAHAGARDFLRESSGFPYSMITGLLHAVINKLSFVNGRISRLLRADAKQPPISAIYDVSCLSPFPVSRFDD
jgi:hypothetical protein